MGISNKLLMDKVDFALAGAASNRELAEAAGAIACAENRPVDFVLTPNDLPAVVDNTGRLVYVCCNNTYMYSDGVVWARDYKTTQIKRTLWMWGSNTYCRIGDGASLNRSSPTVVSADSERNWCKVTVGSQHTLGLKTDGSLWAWGRNCIGQLGVTAWGSLECRSLPVAVGSNYKTMAATYSSSFGIKTDGTLWAWGDGTHGILGDGTTTFKTSPVSTAGGGTTWCYMAAAPTALAGWAVSAIKTDGTLWVWGCNATGELGDNSVIFKSSPVTTAGGGTNWCQSNIIYNKAAGIKTDGTLWTWGSDAIGALGNNTSAANRSSPNTTAGGGTTWCCVTSGETFSAGIKTDGTLWMWGSNLCGRLGDGAVVDRSSPVTIAGSGTNWSKIKMGDYTSLAVKTDGTLWTWGCSNNNLFGFSYPLTRASSPVLAPLNLTWCDVTISSDTHAGGITVSGY